MVQCCIILFPLTSTVPQGAVYGRWLLGPPALPVPCCRSIQTNGMTEGTEPPHVRARRGDLHGLQEFLWPKWFSSVRQFPSFLGRQSSMWATQKRTWSRRDLGVFAQGHFGSIDEWTWDAWWIVLFRGVEWDDPELKSNAAHWNKNIDEISFCICAAPWGLLQPGTWTAGAIRVSVLCETDILSGH